MDDPRAPSEELEEARWQAYLWPSQTGEPMLINLYGLRDESALRAREYADTTKRALDLQLRRKHIPRTGDLTEWQAIHAYLFADTYPWAGQLRTVGMVKRGKDFLHPEDFDLYIPAVFDHARAIDWPRLDREQFIDDASWLFMHLNWIHPFREGNGRATRLFLDRLTADARWRLDYARIHTRTLVNALYDSCPIEYNPPRDPGLLRLAVASITSIRDSTAIRGLQLPGPARMHDRTGSMPGLRTAGGADIGATIRDARINDAAPTTAPTTDPPTPADPSTTPVLEDGPGPDQ